MLEVAECRADAGRAIIVGGDIQQDVLSAASAKVRPLGLAANPGAYLVSAA